MSLRAASVLGLVLLVLPGCAGGDATAGRATTGPATPDQATTDRATPDLSDAPPQATESGVVTNVVDGDTVDVDGVGWIRVIGIDTPEICVPCLVGVADRAVM